MFLHGLELSAIRNFASIHVCSGTVTVCSTVTLQFSSAINKKPERELDYLNKSHINVIKTMHCAQKQNNL